MKNKQDFTQGSILNKMLQFMLPILGAQILQAMYGHFRVKCIVHRCYGTFGPIPG